MVRSRTKATEFSLVICIILEHYKENKTVQISMHIKINNEFVSFPFYGFINNLDTPGERKTILVFF